MKIVSWNVNGIRASWSHGLAASLDECNADIYAFQETKTNEEISMIELEGYRAYWSFCTRRKGYSGTLCLTKQKPLNIRYDMGDFDFDTEGRIITLEFEDFFFVNCYVPNSQRSDRRYDYRSSWDFMLLQYLIQLRCQKPTIACGDFNVPISDKDIYEENKWVELNAEGFQSTERESLLEIIDCGYIDTYRLLHPDETGKYTWWSNRRFKRKENRGWRLDYFLVSKKLRDKVTESTMLSDVYGSDHAMKAKKHLYDHIIYDSSNEQKFATELGTNTNVAVYVKLPDGFYISTPVGHYNPDWAIAFYEGTVKHIYFVAETKGSMNSMQLRLIEESKIHCAREHFKAISNGEVVYDVVDSYQSLLDLMTK